MERERFVHIVRAHHGAVYRSALRVTRHAADAEDVTQRVFLDVLRDAWRVPASGDPERSLRWYAVRCALALLRDRRHRARRERGDTMEPPRDAAGPPALDAEDRTLLRQHLDRLPEDLRLAVVLRYQEGLTYRDIARACDCAEPTAHDRVRRGLDRLRTALQRAGFAAALPHLGELLDRLDEPPVPDGLLGTLLAAQAPLGAAFPLAVFAACVALVTGLVFAAVELAPASAAPGDAAVVAHAGETQDPASRSTVRRREEVPERPSEREGTRMAQRMAAPPASVRGLVRDAERAPQAAAWVSAVSRETVGKLPRFERTTRTDAAGRFDLELPVDHADGQTYDVLVAAPGSESRRYEALRLRAREARDLGEVVLAPRVAEREAPWELSLFVHDGLGNPVAGASARAFEATSAWTDVAARTDENGFCLLRGTHLAVHRVVVAGTRAFAPAVTQVEIERGGRHERQVALEPGWTLSGRVTMVDGSIPEPLGLVAFDPHTEVQHPAWTDRTGAFRFEGLAPRPHRLGLAWSQGHSPFAREVEPGGPPLTVTLKPLVLARDVGWHGIELHGRVFDAATGEPVPVDPFAVELQRVAPGSRAAALRACAVDLLSPWSVQREASDVEERERHAFHLAGLEPGDTLVAVRARGYALAVLGPLTLEAGAFVGDLDVRLERGAALRGRVFDPEGRPLPEAVLYLSSAGEPSDAVRAERDARVAATNARGPLTFWPAWRTDAEGRFAIDHVPAGFELTLTVLHPRHEPVVEPLGERPVTREDVTLSFLRAR